MDDNKKLLDLAAEVMTVSGYYGPLFDRYPVMDLGKAPSTIRDMVKARETFACTDSNYVYIDVDMLDKEVKEIKEKSSCWVNDDILDNLVTVLAHEFTHIVCQHRRIGEALYNSYKGKVPHAVMTAHILACDIEANRGMLVNNGSAVYQVGVTDDKYPSTKQCRYYTEIFNKLLEEYNDNKELMEQLVSAIKEAYGINDNNKDKDNENKGKNGKGKDGKGSGKGSGDAKDNGTGQNPELGTGLGKGDNDGKDKDKDKEEWPDIPEELIEAAKKVARETVTKVMSEDSGGNERGYGLDDFLESVSSPDVTPEDRLKAMYSRWHKTEVKRALKKIKGFMTGSMTRHKVATYARPTRRPISGSTTLIRKGVRNERDTMPKVLVAMDSSGSMSSTVMKEVACAVGNIYKDMGCPQTGSYICRHTNMVEDITPLRDWKKVVKTFYPSGGNSFANVVKEANRLGMDVVLNIGDGQDFCNRGSYGDNISPELKKFVSKNRKWVDVLITSKGSNRYYFQAKQDDEKAGFHRDAIFLGDDITKYTR